eukprot:XP_001691615.1 predicted protein [Chlamydomonas reinhardtii]
MYADSFTFSVYGTSQTLESLPDVRVTYDVAPTNTPAQFSREFYDAIVIPKLALFNADPLTDDYYSLIDFIYDGGAVIIGPGTQMLNVTSVFLSSLATKSSSRGDPGYSTVLVCNSSVGVDVPNAASDAMRQLPGFAPATDATWSSPAAFPDYLAAGGAQASAYLVDCGDLSSVNGTVMYGQDSNFIPMPPPWEAAVLSFPRGDRGGRVYYVGVDLDTAPWTATWGQLLRAIVMKAASGALPSNLAYASPPPSAPSAPGDWQATAPAIDPATSNASQPWPLARGRYSYTSSGATAAADLAEPLSTTAGRSQYTCHIVPRPTVDVDGYADPTSSWLVLDLGTARRVYSVRIQTLIARMSDEALINTTSVDPVRIQVRVGDTPVQSSLQSAFGQSSNVAANPELCSPAASSTGGSSDHYLAVGRSPTAYDDPGALVVSCGSAGSLVSLGAMLGTAYEAWLIVQPVPAASRAVGRYVSISLLDDVAVPFAMSSVMLCGVDVMGVIPDTWQLVSRSKPVCATESKGGVVYPAEAQPSLAVDGLYNNNRNSIMSMCALSDLAASPYIMVDLGGIMVVERVEVTKSVSAAHSHELSGFTIAVTTENPCVSPESVAASTQPWQFCARGLSLAPGETGVYNCSGMVGRFVSLALPEDFNAPRYLRVCELDVYASLPGSGLTLAGSWGSESFLMSVNKPTATTPNALVDSLLVGQSNTTAKAMPGLLVDGVTPKDVRAAAAATGSDPVSLPLASMCVNITSEAAYNTSAWVGVDLGAVLMVRYVKVHYMYDHDRLYTLDFSYYSTVRADVTLRLSNSSVDGVKTFLGLQPACVQGAGFFTGVEYTTDLYGTGGNHIRRYGCGFMGRFVYLVAERPAGDSSNPVALPPVCEVEVFVASDAARPLGYLSSLNRLAAVTTGTAVDVIATRFDKTAGSRALQGPNYDPLKSIAESTRCALCLGVAGQAVPRAFWVVDLGSVRLLSMVQMLGGIQFTNVKIMALDADVPLDPTSPLSTSTALVLPGAAFLTISQTTGIVTWTPAANNITARYVLVMSMQPEQPITLCQEGVPGSGARPGVAVALVRGRATQEVGSVSVGITLNVVARRRELLALQQQPPLGGRRAMSAAGAAANAITAFGSSSSSYDGRSSYDGSSSSGYSGRRRLLQSTFGPALLLLDLALVRSVEVAVLTTPKVSTYAEIANVQIAVSNSSTGAGGGAFCAFDVTLPLSLTRHVFGCGGAFGRYLVAQRSDGLGLLPGSGLEAFLVDPGNQLNVALNKPTNQSGGVVTGIGGSNNAVNGYYDSASVAAAPVAGRVVAFGSATAAVAAPYWSVDLGSAVPLVWVEVTAHPTAADGQGLLSFDIVLSNATLVTGSEGVTVLTGLSLAAGATGRYPLGGAAARQLVVRQPTATRSMELAQVDVIADKATITANDNQLITPKPLFYPTVRDTYRTAGAYLDSFGVSTTGELAPLAVDGAAVSDSVQRCSRTEVPLSDLPWLMVDLGAPRKVLRLALLKANDPAAAGQLDDVDVVLGDSPSGSVVSANPVVLSGLRLPTPGVWAFFELPATAAPGRYLAVRGRSPGATLVVCEIAAYGALQCVRVGVVTSRAQPAAVARATQPRTARAALPRAFASAASAASTPAASTAQPGPFATSNTYTALASTLTSAPFPTTRASTPSAASKQSTLTVAPVATDPTAVTVVTASVVAVTVATSLAATLAASAVASAAASGAGGAIAASVPGGAATGGAGGAAATAFVGHLQFFALTSHASAQVSGSYTDTNSALGWLNLEYDTLLKMGVTWLPDAEQKAYSQARGGTWRHALNVGLVFTGVLLLHVSLVLTVQYIRRNSAACAAFWCWCVRRRPPQPPRVLAAGGPVAEALESRASIAAATSPASFRKRKLGIMLPDFLVFPYLEIFIYVFFLVSLANAAGMLVAVGFAASPHRVAPIAVGIGILVLMAALTAAAVVLLTRMYRRAARLGLEYVPKPRPPPQGEREGRVSRWLRLAERGFWERPEGVEVKLLEPLRTEHYLTAGAFNPAAALAAADPDARLTHLSRLATRFSRMASTLTFLNSSRRDRDREMFDTGSPAGKDAAAAAAVTVAVAGAGAGAAAAAAALASDGDGMAGSGVDGGREGVEGLSAVVVRPSALRIAGMEGALGGSSHSSSVSGIADGCTGGGGGGDSARGTLVGGSSFFNQSRRSNRVSASNAPLSDGEASSMTGSASAAAVAVRTGPPPFAERRSASGAVSVGAWGSFTPGTGGGSTNGMAPPAPASVDAAAAGGAIVGRASASGTVVVAAASAAAGSRPGSGMPHRSESGSLAAALLGHFRRGGVAVVDLRDNALFGDSTYSAATATPPLTPLGVAAPDAAKAALVAPHVVQTDSLLLQSGADYAAAAVLGSPTPTATAGATDVASAAAASAFMSAAAVTAASAAAAGEVDGSMAAFAAALESHDSFTHASHRSPTRLSGGGGSGWHGSPRLPGAMVGSPSASHDAARHSQLEQKRRRRKSLIMADGGAALPHDSIGSPRQLSDDEGEALTEAANAAAATLISRKSGGGGGGAGHITGGRSRLGAVEMTGGGPGALHMPAPPEAPLPPAPAPPPPAAPVPAGTAGVAAASEPPPQSAAARMVAAAKALAEEFAAMEHARAQKLAQQQQEQQPQEQQQQQAPPAPPSRRTSLSGADASNGSQGGGILAAGSSALSRKSPRRTTIDGAAASSDRQMSGRPLSGRPPSGRPPSGRPNASGAAGPGRLPSAAQRNSNSISRRDSGLKGSGGAADDAVAAAAAGLGAEPSATDTAAGGGAASGFMAADSRAAAAAWPASVPSAMPPPAIRVPSSSGDKAEMQRAAAAAAAAATANGVASGGAAKAPTVVIGSPAGVAALSTRDSVGAAKLGSPAGQEPVLPIELQIRRVEVYERYGQLFEEFRGGKIAAATFQGALLANAIVPAVLLAVQAGADMAAGSRGAKATNIALLCVKALFAIYMSAVLPFSNAITMTAELVCSWLEAAVCAGLVALQWYAGAKGISSAMAVCEVLVIALQILRILLTSAIPCIIVVWEWSRIHCCLRCRRRKSGSGTGPAAIASGGHGNATHEGWNEDDGNADRAAVTGRHSKEHV